MHIRSSSVKTIGMQAFINMIRYLSEGKVIIHPFPPTAMWQNVACACLDQCDPLMCVCKKVTPAGHTDQPNPNPKLTQWSVCINC